MSDADNMRRVLQDFLAPELRGIREQLTGIKEQISDLKASDARLHEEIRTTESRLTNKIDSTRVEQIDRIELSKKEVLLSVENRYLRNEVEELRKRPQ